MIFNKLTSDIKKKLDPTTIPDALCASACDTILEYKKRDNYIYEDLEIFSNQTHSKNSSLCELLNKSSTFIGKSFFRMNLSKIKTNVLELNNEKNKIKLVLNCLQDTQTMSKVTKCLDSIKQNEKYLLSFFLENKDEANLIKLIYFNDHFEYFKLNDNEEVMKMYTTFTMYSPQINLVYPIFMLLLPVIINKLFNALGLNESSVLNFITNYAILKYNIFKISSMKELIYSVFTVIMFVLNLYVSSKVASETNTIINIMETKIINVTKIITNTLELQSCFKDNIFDNLKLVFEEFKKVKPKNDKGFIIVFYKKLKDLYNKLNVYLKFIGEIDYYVCLKKNIDTKQYSLVSYEMYPKPFIFMKEFSHPYLFEINEPVVKNSVILGLNDSPQNMILTGPNAGGKSTLIKSILVNILLAQTIGISFCDKLFFTPFQHLYSIMNIQDTKGELSFFESEITKINTYLNNLELHKSNNKYFSLIIIDELCSGTNIIEGSKISYAIAKYLGKHNNSMSLITTHLNNMSTLEQYENYMMNIEIQEEKINYTYTLKKGISNVKLAVHVLKKFGINKEILNDLIN